MPSSQPEPIDDQLAAACLAAVLAYMQQEKPQASPDVKLSAWLAANRLSAVGKGRRRLLPSLTGKSLWRIASYPLIALLLIANSSPSTSASNLHCRPKALSQAPIPENNGQDPVSTTKSIRIALLTGARSFNLGAPDGVEVSDLATGAKVAILPPETDWRIAVDSDKLLMARSTGNDSPAGRLAASSSEGERPAPPQGSDYLPVRFTPTIPSSNTHPSSLPEATVPLSLPLPRLARVPGPISKEAATDGGRLLGSSPGPKPGEAGYLVVAPGSTDGLFALNGKLYRGALKVCTGKNGELLAINVLDLEDYLLSVVPSEMPSEWPIEALKAQAVAARSFAVANLGKHGSDGYDLKATSEDQVYRGVISESESTNKAVAETSGVVLKHQGKAITAFFHSTSGGCTELPEHVWGNSVAFAKSVADYDDASPHFSWTREFTADKIEVCLKSQGQNPGSVLAIIVIARGQSQRASRLLLVSDSKSRIVSASQFRQMLKLPSTNFNLGYNDNAYVFAGRGFGHAVGLSQWGARALAVQGYNAAQILAYYYKDVTLEYF